MSTKREKNSNWVWFPDKFQLLKMFVFLIPIMTTTENVKEKIADLRYLIVGPKIFRLKQLYTIVLIVNMNPGPYLLLNFMCSFRPSNVVKNFIFGPAATCCGLNLQF